MYDMHLLRQSDRWIETIRLADSNYQVGWQ